MSDGTILDEIIAHKKNEVDALKRSVPLSSLRAMTQDMAETRGFSAALGDRKLAVIAEIKKASPSKGVIREDSDPIAIARSYEEHGAACLSVLTDERFFRGSSAALRAARNECRLPVLRKDFIVDEYLIYETRVLPADCLLLIVAVLDQAQLAAFHDIALGLGLDVLVEVHDEAELERALDVNARLIGINNRNLKTFGTDLAITERLVTQIPKTVRVVSESGIQTSKDVARLRACGVHAFLVGEAFMRENDPGRAMKWIFATTDWDTLVQDPTTTHAS